ncbi:MAG: DUF1801 domain-containing protein [Acidobacteriota bacterium]|nr:DUF1801 domain-containing protein [Acidobacteriota bacterium]
MKASGAKTSNSATDRAGLKAVEAYLARVPEPARGTLEKVRAAIRAAAPAAATEGLSYGMPALHYKGALVAYAAFKNHCSFFPMSLAVLADLKDELATYQTSKGTLQFPLDKPLRDALVRKLVKARVAEKDAKKAR